MADLEAALKDLVIANRVLAREGVVDAFGHASIRHPDDPTRYFISRARAPELVERDDLVECTLDGTPFNDRGRRLYAERHIHGAIYEARPEVGAVIHNHSYAVIPFTVTQAKLRPLLHTSGGMGAEIPVWDIRRKFGDTNLLVRNMEHGRDLAATHAANTVTLMRGHGCVVSGADIKSAVMVAVYTQVNAALQLAASSLGQIEFLTPGEVGHCAEMVVSPLSMERSWEYFVLRAGCQDM